MTAREHRQDTGSVGSTAPLSSLPPGPVEFERVERRARAVALGMVPLGALVLGAQGWWRWSPLAAQLAARSSDPRAEQAARLATRWSTLAASVLAGAFLFWVLGFSLVWCAQVLPGLGRNHRLVNGFVRRDLRSRYAGSLLGFFWSVVNPFVNLVVYLFVFRIVLKARWSDTMGAEEVTFIMLTGIVVWSALAETLMRATLSMIDNSNLIQKVVFPVEVLPTFMSASALFNMTLALPVVLLGTWWIGNHSGDYMGARQAALEAGKQVGPAMDVGLSLVLLPVLYVLQMVFMTGLGFFMATLNVLVRDIQQLVPVATMVWMFTTPIFYPAELVKKAGFGFLLEANPMYWMIDCYRSVLMYASVPDWWLLLRFALVSAMMLGVGTRFLAQHRRRFPDLL